jgi:hypothetical protein
MMMKSVELRQAPSLMSNKRGILEKMTVRNDYCDYRNYQNSTRKSKSEGGSC